MKIFLTLTLLLVNFSCFAQLSSNNLYLIVEGIAKIENSTKYPYGIKSIPLKGNNLAEKREYARQICSQTVINNWKRYQNEPNRKTYHCYLDFLGSRYYPQSVDPQGYTNWIGNIHSVVKISKKELTVK